MNDINQSKLWFSISSVLNGDHTEEEKQYVTNWIQESDRNRKLFEELCNLQPNHILEQEAQKAKDKIYKKVQAKIVEASFKLKLRLWQSIAVASLVLLLLAVGLEWMRSDRQEPINLESSTPAGGTTRLCLSDKTLVTLNATSSIEYPYNFTGDTRQVNLRGEAYFEVANNPKRPFIVETNQLKIEVLGTHFNIKAYDDDDKIITTLLEGSVKVIIKSIPDSKEPAIVLKPNQQLVFNRQTSKLTVTTVDADLYASWKEGQCFFENEPFFEISKILERHFGIPILIHSTNLRNQHYSGVFTKKEGIIQILNSFKNFKHFTYQQTDKGIEIYEK